MTMTPQEALAQALMDAYMDSDRPTAAAILDALPEEWALVSRDELLGRALLLAAPSRPMSTDEVERAMRRVEDVIAQQERERLRRRHIYLYHHEDGDDYSRRPGCAWCAFLADPEDNKEDHPNAL
jgi:hypothetical protein